MTSTNFRFPTLPLISATMAEVRWGIVGAGKISFDFCLALRTLPASDHCIKAIASRSLERSREFAGRFGIEKAYGAYDELFQDNEIDVVYVGTLTPSHKEFSIKAMMHGKHVLCEKPLTKNSKELEELLAFADSKQNVIFMEGMWTRHFPLYHDLQKMIKDGVIGDVKAVQVSFGFELESVDRVMKPELGGTVLGDIGIYAVNFADIVFMGEKPTNISATGVFSDSGVDLVSSMTFIYSGKRVAQMLCSGNVVLPNEAVIAGTKGKIIVKAPFWCPTCIRVNNEEKQYPLPDTMFPTNFFNSAGLRFEAEHMRQLIMQKKSESDVVSHDVSRRIMAFLDEIISQMKR